MMIREQLKVGMEVYFGRLNGERTLGRIEKLNSARAKIKTLQNRGHKNRGPGVTWSVPYSMIYPTSEGTEELTNNLRVTISKADGTVLETFLVEADEKIGVIRTAAKIAELISLKYETEEL